jgi:hypothetical protein
MNSSQAFIHFVSRALVPAKAKRFASLASSKKSQCKVLDDLCHRFESAVITSRIGNNFQSIRQLPCFAFHTSCGFGIEFTTVDAAYDSLSLLDGWLIVVADGSFAIYRPESRWDNEMVIST